MHLAARAFHLRQPVERLVELAAQCVDVDVALREQVARTAALLIEQRRQHVCRFDLLVVAPEREALGLAESGLELRGQLVHAHGLMALVFGY